MGESKVATIKRKSVRETWFLGSSSSCLILIRNWSVEIIATQLLKFVAVISQTNCKLKPKQMGNHVYTYTYNHLNIQTLKSELTVNFIDLSWIQKGHVMFDKPVKKFHQRCTVLLIILKTKPKFVTYQIV